MYKRFCLAIACLLLVGMPVMALDLTGGMKQGTVDIQSAGPLAFGPDGILFVGDPQGAVVYAIATGDTSGNPESVKLNIDGLGEKIAAALGTKADDILINDLAVNPASGNAYVSVSRGRGPSAAGVLLQIDGAGKISEVGLKNAKYSVAELPNAVAKDAVDRRRRPQRTQSITDLGYHDGRLLVAGLSNEEFASNLRAIPFPFDVVDSGAAVEIYHGAHGAFETRSPVRTFATYEIESKPHLLAAYTCTPLVKFPLSDLKAGKKVRGTTVAELGNRNRPLDMFVYKSGGKDYILMANSARGMMKISTDDLDRSEGITERVGGGGKAGQTYDTIDSLDGVEQLAQLNSKNALVIQRDEDGGVHLRTVALP